MHTSRAVVFKAFSDTVVRGTGLITFPVIARHVNASGYGAYAQVGVVVAVIAPIASLGLGTVMVRFFSTAPWTKALVRQMLRVGLGVAIFGLVGSVLVFLLAQPLNDAFLGYPDGEQLFRWGSLLVLAGALEFWVLDLLRARYWLIQFSAFQLAESLLFVAATVVLLVSGHGVVALIQASLAIKLGFVLLAVAAVAWHGRSDSSEAAPATPAFGALVRFGLPLAVAGLGLWLVQLSDRLVVGHSLGAAPVGRYSIAYNMGLLVAAAAAPLLLPAYTRIVRGAAGGANGAVAEDVRLFHRYVVITVVPVAVWLAVIVPTTVRTLGGQNFHVAWAMCALVIGGLFLDQWNGLAHYVLIAYNRTLLSQNTWIAGGLLNVGLCLVLVPRYQLNGAAFATLASFVFIEGIMFVAAMRHVDLIRSYRYDTTLRTGLAALVAGAAAAVPITLISSGGTAVLAATGTFLIVLLGLLTAFREIGRGEIRLVLSALRRREAV
jgi:O-antigen/teichoic acid export membrane protein